MDVIEEIRDEARGDAVGIERSGGRRGFIGGRELLSQTLDGESRDHLGLAVIGELEIVDDEIVDRLAFRIPDDNRDRDEIDAGMECDGGFSCGHFRSLGEYGTRGEEEGNQREMGADMDGFILSFLC